MVILMAPDLPVENESTSGGAAPLVAVGVGVAVGVDVAVLVDVGVEVAVAVGVGVGVDVEVDVAVGVGVAVGPQKLEFSSSLPTPKNEAGVFWLLNSVMTQSSERAILEIRISSS